MTTNEINYITNKDVAELVERTQRIVEGAHFSMREYNLKLDDVINDQRSVVYTLRDSVLEGEDLIGKLKAMLFETVEFAVLDNSPEELPSNEWKFDKMEDTLNSLLLSPVSINREFTKQKEILKAISNSVDELAAFMEKYGEDERVQQVIPRAILTMINNMWVKHLEQMTHLKEGIGLRHYQQEDPMRIYQREGLELFGKNYQELRRSIVKELITFLKVIAKQEEEVK